MTDKAARVNALLSRLGIAAKVTLGAGYVLVLAKTGMDLDLALVAARQATPGLRVEHEPLNPRRLADARCHAYRARVWA